MAATNSPILPGATIGVLGSGQLGRMFALAARAMGYRIHIYSPEDDPPAGQVADREVVGEYTDLEKIREFARRVSVATFEFENIPVVSTQAASELTLVRPHGSVLHITQNRLREKAFLSERGFPVTGFRAVASLPELQKATRELGRPCILKTADFGYDGKGQIKIQPEDDLDLVWKRMNGALSVCEAYVPFEKELSVVGARTIDGQFSAFPVFENTHANHILDVTFAPAEISPALALQAAEMTREILAALDVVGLLTVEMFLAPNDRLLVNELAPRTHNSGHLTIDAAVTSQFEQQVRAVCGLPLGSTELLRPGAMANLLGDVWRKGEPNWTAALADPLVKLHLYGKAEPRPGRKMGHLTATGRTAAEAVEKVRAARGRLL